MNPDSIVDLHEQEVFWNSWNKEIRENSPVNQYCEIRAHEVEKQLDQLNISHSKILEVGCGSGWFSERLANYGQVTATDLAGDVIQRAQKGIPHIKFIAGDFHQMIFNNEFDIVVSLETISYVYDQKLFVKKIASALKKHGYLILTSVNKLVYERRDDIDPVKPGQIRNWLFKSEISALLLPYFKILRNYTVEPSGSKGILRVINSHKINKLASLVLTNRLLKKLKEKAGLGQTIVVVGKLK